MSKVLSDEIGDKKLYAVSEAIESVMWKEKKLFANADFFCSECLSFYGHTYLFIYPNICLFKNYWMGCTYNGAERE